MEDYRHLWEERFDRLAAQLEARKQRRSGEPEREAQHPIYNSPKEHDQ